MKHRLPLIALIVTTVGPSFNSGVSPVGPSFSSGVVTATPIVGPSVGPSFDSGATITASSQPSSPPSDGLAPHIAAVLRQIKSADVDQLAVSEEDGRFLRLMAASSRATRALEIGGASGYSAIWIGLGLRETGGTLTTIEFDPARAKVAAENVRRAGLSNVVTVVPGDAFTEIPKLTGTFDFVFLDAWKRDYKRFFDVVFPRMTPRGLFLAHNVINKRSEMGDFLAAIQDNPAALSTIVAPSGEGMSVTLKLEVKR